MSNETHLRLLRSRAEVHFANFKNRSVRDRCGAYFVDELRSEGAERGAGVRVEEDDAAGLLHAEGFVEVQRINAFDVVNKYRSRALRKRPEHHLSREMVALPVVSEEGELVIRVNALVLIVVACRVWGVVVGEGDGEG